MTKNQSELSQTVHFDIFTLFPAMFAGPFEESILARARERGMLQVELHNIRAFTTDRHHVCDGTPYGGGGGMVMRPEPIVRAVETVLSQPPGWRLQADDAYTNPPPWDPNRPPPAFSPTPVILLSPQGRRFDQRIATELSRASRIALICGRYEGVDERVRNLIVTDEISIGDYVLSGGELAAMVIVDAVTRLLPGALGAPTGATDDSHGGGTGGLLEGAHYTRPQIFRDQSVPDVLLSGHHAEVAKWRRRGSLLRTLERRPDLLAYAARSQTLEQADLEFLREQGWEDPSSG